MYRLINIDLEVMSVILIDPTFFELRIIFITIYKIRCVRGWKSIGSSVFLVVKCVLA